MLICWHLLSKAFFVINSGQYRILNHQEHLILRPDFSGQREALDPKNIRSQPVNRSRRVLNINRGHFEKNLITSHSCKLGTLGYSKHNLHFSIMPLGGRKWCPLKIFYAMNKLHKG